MTLDDLPSTLTLHLGERRLWPLPGALGGGYAWSVLCVRGPAVARVHIELQPPLPEPGAADGSPPMAALAREHLVVEALRSGQAHWRLVLARPFELPVTLREHDLQLRVPE